MAQKRSLYSLTRGDSSERHHFRSISVAPQPQRHHRIFAALVLDEHIHERPQFIVTKPVRYLKRQVGFAAAPVVQRKLAFEQAAALAVKTAGQRGHGLMQERAEIGRMLQRLADNAVSQVARRFAAWGHG